jgi:acetyltransferase-like isoleucine patch superfamily enzyme
MSAPGPLKRAVEWRLRNGWFARVVREAVHREVLVFGPSERLEVGKGCDLSGATINLMSGRVLIGDGTFVGHNVSLLAGTHDISKRGAERYAAVPEAGHDIIIGKGVWLASNVTVLGPCRIGDDAVVAAGAVVTSDVPAETIVGGTPARPIKSC